MFIRSFTLALLLLAPLVNAEPLDGRGSEDNILGTVTGRYVFGQVSPASGDQFLLDTDAGRLWQLVSDKRSGTRLVPIKIVQLYGEEANLPEPTINDDRRRAEIRAETLEKMDAEKK